MLQQTEQALDGMRHEFLEFETKCKSKSRRRRKLNPTKATKVSILIFDETTPVMTKAHGRKAQKVTGEWQCDEAKLEYLQALEDNNAPNLISVAEEFILQFFQIGRASCRERVF